MSYVMRRQILSFYGWKTVLVQKLVQIIITAYIFKQNTKALPNFYLHFYKLLSLARKEVH